MRPAPRHERAAAAPPPADNHHRHPHRHPYHPRHRHRRHHHHHHHHHHHPQNQNPRCVGIMACSTRGRAGTNSLITYSQDLLRNVESLQSCGTGPDDGKRRQCGTASSNKCAAFAGPRKADVLLHTLSAEAADLFLGIAVDSHRHSLVCVWYRSRSCSWFSCGPAN